MAKDKGLTPMMKQFFSFKAQHPDALLLFRCGDFYETYGEDAVISSGILGITLTKRNNGGSGDVTEMAGFPYHALDTYLPKLIRAGRRVAICDQLEDPKKKREQIKGKKGLTEMDKMVKRGITELVTPGVALSDNVLNYKENNFLAAVHFGKTAVGVSFLDISTGEFLTGEGTFDHVDKLLGNFQPKEVLYDRRNKTDFDRYFGGKYCVFEMDDWDRAVYTAISTDDAEYQKQRSRFKGIRGTAQRPVCAIAIRPEGRALEFYSCKSTDANVSRAVYIPYPKIDEDGGIDICQRCYKAVIYMIASLALITCGEHEKGDAAAKLAQTLLK